MDQFVAAVRAGKADQIDQALAQAGSQKQRILSQVHSLGFTLLGEAARCGKTEVVRVLVNHGSNINERDPQLLATPLINAVCHCHEGLPSPSPLLSSSILPPSPHPLLLTFFFCPEVLLFLLTQTNLDVNIADRNKHAALHWAILLDHEPWARLLLEKGARHDLTTDKKQTPLHLAGPFPRPSLDHTPPHLPPFSP